MNIREVAARAGYGVGTVSRVINGQANVSEQARSRILAVVEACGYEPNSNARYLKRREHTPVAAFVMGTSNRLFSDILASIQARLEASGEELVVTYLDDDAQEVTAAIAYQQARRPKGMLFLGGERTYFREAFDQIEVPSVLITNSAAGLGFANLSSVTIDNEAAAAEVIDYLWSRGHRRIGLLGGSNAPEQTAGMRLRGAEQALRDRNAPFDATRDYEPCRFAEQDGYTALIRLLDRASDITAVFALGDVIAFGALRAAVDRGLAVPRDLSLVGFDGTALAQFSIPRITTVRQDTEALAQQSVELLRSLMDAGGEAAHTLVPYELVAQETVCAR